MSDYTKCLLLPYDRDELITYLNNGVLKPRPDLQLSGEQTLNNHPNNKEHLELQSSVQGTRPHMLVQNIDSKQVYGKA